MEQTQRESTGVMHVRASRSQGKQGAATGNAFIILMSRNHMNQVWRLECVHPLILQIRVGDPGDDLFCYGNKPMLRHCCLNFPFTVYRIFTEFNAAMFRRVSQLWNFF